MPAIIGIITLLISFSGKRAGISLVNSIKLNGCRILSLIERYGAGALCNNFSY